MLTILVILLCCLSIEMIDTKILRESDVYSSVHDLSKLFVLEQRLVRNKLILKGFILGGYSSYD